MYTHPSMPGTPADLTIHTDGRTPMTGKDDWTTVGTAARDGMIAGLDSAPADFGSTLTAKSVHPETMALMTGMHPSNFETIHAEGRALVSEIIERKKESTRMKPLAAEEQA